MTPETSSFAPPGQETGARASFRRGQILVWVVVLVTGGYLVQSAVREIWAQGFSAAASDRATGWITEAILCWFVVRGGKFAVGCFAAAYGLVMVLFATITAFIVASILLPTKHSLDFDLGLGSTVFALLQVAWAVFALWVLLLSREACFYMRMRREGTTQIEAGDFEWPPSRGGR